MLTASCACRNSPAVRSSTIITKTPRKCSPCTTPSIRSGRNCRITKAIVNENVVIPDGTVIGSEDGEITVVGKSL